MPALDIGSTIDGLQSLINQLDSQAAEIARKEADAREILAKCASEKTGVESQRKKLEEALEVCRVQYGPLMTGDTGLRPLATIALKAADREMPPRQKRARVGPQRYLMLNHLRQYGRTTPEDIAKATTLDLRRVKEQLAADLRMRYVDSVLIAPVTQGALQGYEINAAGLDLLERFEASRRTRGVSLPTLEDAKTEVLVEAPKDGESDEEGDDEAT